jgi:hypothetical protein
MHNVTNGVILNLHTHNGGEGMIPVNLFFNFFRELNSTD